MIPELFCHRRILWELAKNDCKARFSNSFLGVVWNFLQPLINMLVIWLVFQVGFKSSNISEDVPFIIWYMPAFLIWNYFSESLSQASGSLLEYSYLVKKVNFYVEVIPSIKIISNGMVHMFFMLFIVFVNFCYGRMFSVYYLQAAYYFICAAGAALAFGWLFSAIVPFVPDVMNIVSIIIQIGFWVTPIFWDPSNLNEAAMYLLKINPMYYVCMGYRDSFVYGRPAWEHPLLGLYFWGVTISVWMLGTKLYRKSKPHFDDVL